MTLGFMQQFPWSTKKNQAPTNFREKILSGVGRYELTGDPPIRNPDNTHSWPVKLYTPKIHTMREDPLGRWKVGMGIQMVYRGAGYKIIDHFNKGIPELEKCSSTQKIRIVWSGDDSDIGQLSKALGISRKHLVIIVDGKEVAEFTFTYIGCGLTDPYKIVENDGFVDSFQFAKWFKKDWNGKIIHWTDLRY